MTLRTYHFAVNGCIDGIPGHFPAGSSVVVEEDTKSVVRVLPFGGGDEIEVHVVAVSEAITPKEEVTVAEVEAPQPKKLYGSAAKMVADKAARLAAETEAVPVVETAVVAEGKQV